MAIIIKPKHSNTASSVPTTGNLADGEFAINVADKKIYQRVGSTVYEVANAADLDATLVALANNNWAANSIPVGTGADTMTQYVMPANRLLGRNSVGGLTGQVATDFGLSLIDDADAATARSTLGLGTAATTASTAYATAAQGTLASTAVQPARTISTTAPLTGGGDLSANRTLAISAATSGAAGSMSAADKAKLDLVASGTWTPTLTSVANVTGFGGVFPGQYIRVGSVVHASCRIAVNATTANTEVEVGISLPVASNFSSGFSDELAGTATWRGASVNVPGQVLQDDTNDRATLRYFPPATGMHFITVVMTYRIV